jgi:hypothetical protein
VLNNRLATSNNNAGVGGQLDGDDITKISTTVLGDTTTTSTTTFVNESPTNILRVLSDTPHSRSVVDSASSGNLDQSIASFMAKPYPVATGSITTANLAGSLVFRFDIAPQLTSRTIWNDKVKGWMNMRGTAKVRLQINANPFQAGRLILAYIPQYSHSPRSYTPHLTTLMTITQLPHVEMSFQDAECELEIPYISPTTHYNILTGYYDWGSVFCYIYSPLAIGSAGTNQVTYTCWLSFDDFELSVPIIPQSGGYAKKNVIKKYRVNAIKSNLDSEVNEGEGPISSILSNVSSLASSMYAIPMLSPIAGPTAWFSNLASGVASAFGWSKPTLDSQLVRVYHNPHAYMANINESDTTNNLGLIQDNKVKVMDDVNLSGVDEMSFDFIKRQKAFLLTIPWLTTTLPGNLVKLQMSPDLMLTNLASAPLGLTSDVNPSTFAPIGYLCKFFRYWRGSIEITIKIVKTQYHTGRLLLALRPNTSSVSITNADSNYLHREIIDLRDGSEFTLRIPYCYNTMYACTDSTLNAHQFYLHINILNELVAPETCTQTVDLLIEVRGGPDFEVQVPVPFNQIPIQYISPQSGGDAPEVMFNSAIGGSTIHDPDKLASQLCIGEHATSVLQLCKRYIKLATTSLSWTTADKLTIYPYIYGGAYTSGVPSGGSSAELLNDYLGAFAPCYAHSRGGIRYRMVKNTDGPGNGVICTLVNLFSSNTPVFLGASASHEKLGLPNIAITGTTTALNASTAFDNSATAGATIAVPMYSRTFTRLNRITYDNSPAAFGSVIDPDISLMRLQFVAGTATEFGTSSLYRAAADDFQFSFWLGVPTMGWINP